jgi:prevent-host-death family protein
MMKEGSVQEIAISKFKATCLAVLENVRTSGKPVIVTRFGQPVAQIIPPAISKPKRWLGAMEGTGEITGDIIAPAIDPEEWGY